jgi:hypothetical protein
MRRRSGIHLRGVFKRHKTHDKHGRDVKALKSTLSENILPMNTQNVSSKF